MMWWQTNAAAVKLRGRGHLMPERRKVERTIVPHMQRAPADSTAKVTRKAMWGLVQQAIAKIEFDFARYADDHFARLEQIAAEPRFGRALR